MKQIEVVAAIIRKGDKIFATQRGYGEWLGKDELDSVKWLPADVEVVEVIKSKIQ
jgi:8-oxo-dGTP diphosphatase